MADSALNSGTQEVEEKALPGESHERMKMRGRTTHHRKRMLTILTAILVPITIGLVSAWPAAATNGPQICSTTAALCANSNGGAHSPGNAVVAWTAGDKNNTFVAVHLTGICHGGYVYSRGGEDVCPFHYGSGLNSKFNGDAIVEFEDYATVGKYTVPMCIADSGNGTGSTTEDPCSWVQNNYGWGGADGSVFILFDVENFSDIQNEGPFTAVNFYWTNHALDTGCGNQTKACFLVEAGPGAPLYESYPTNMNNWDEFP